VVAVEPELDLVTRLDSELAAKLLRDDHLALGADSRSHTKQYNQTLLLDDGEDGTAFG
jgi:hypothetical protein